jgi:archaetidylinositol phosphate synthase
MARRTRLSPNAITTAALATILGGAACLTFADGRPSLFVASLPFVIAGGLLDAFDGIVARVQGKDSPFGDFLDHFCDRVADLALIAGWCVGARIGLEIALLATLSISLNGYLGTQIEATFGTRSYDHTGRGEFVLALIILPLLAFTLARADLIDLSWMGLRILEWATVILALFALLGVVQRFRLAVRLGS